MPYKQFDDPVEWVEKTVNIKYYPYSEFTNMKEINHGSVGNIYQANWKGTDTLLIVKSSYKLTVKEILNEIEIQREVDFHPNILRFYGVSKLETSGLANQINKYLLILEYADGGSLYSYLKEKFNELEWNDKYRLALQLANAVECVHDEGIIHCDLHAYNVLIHRNNVKLADFGLSRKISEAPNYLKDAHGLLPYVDPKCLENQSYVITTKSDVYSIGVLFWQLSSGRRPFYDENTPYDASLAIAIRNGMREDIIKNTPPEYSNLYEACWVDDPNKRPNIQKVVSSLKSIISHENNGEINSIVHVENTENKVSKEDEFTDLVISDFILKYDLDDMTENEIPLYILKQAKKLFDEISGLTIEKIVDKLITLLIKVQDKRGYNFMETNQFINQCINLYDQIPSNDIFNWLVNNQTKPQYIFLLGFLYYNGIIIENNIHEAFKLFSKASEDNYHIAQVYLSKCYQLGTGTEINIPLAIICLRNAIGNNSICAQLYLGNLYEEGTARTNVDLKKAFYWYEKAANNGNSSALYHLGKCYQFGKGIEKNPSKAFEIYKKSAEQENINAQFLIGRCYYRGIGTDIDHVKAFELFKIAAEEGNYSRAQNNFGFLHENGIGTKKDLEKAFHWYHKAAENGHEIAQYNLGEYYELGTGVEKDEVKAFEWYKKSADNNFFYAKLLLGYCYVNGIGTEVNKKKGFELYNNVAQINVERYDYDEKSINILDNMCWWYQKAAEDDSKVALYNLGKCCELEGILQNKVRAFGFYKKSADQGFVDAQYKVGYCYDHGIGVNMNKEKAFDFYKIAAQEENRDAQKSLAFLYEQGKGTEKNIEKAIYWYEKAVKNGSHEAKERLDNLSSKNS
ncbi:kinase-like protein [Rhizophagus irregularis]|uniref:Kinase-like protein n=1 Tax=Rhizophagus irregularis TaxID=588596 RepID=A0A2N1MTM1_9GLOM|nr:kinase-like protein [Rhizophagus irregularis]